MEHAQTVAETRAEASHRLRRERDLRHQHDGASAAGKHLGDHLQIHLGLAAVGRAVEQHHLRKGGVVEHRVEGVERLFLLRRRRQRRTRHDLEVFEIALDRDLLDRDELRFHQRRQARGAEVGVREQLFAARRAVREQYVQQRTAPGGVLFVLVLLDERPRRRFVGDGVDARRRRTHFPSPHRRRQQRADRLFARTAVILRHPLAELDEMLRHRRAVGGKPEERLQLFQRIVAGLDQLQHIPLAHRIAEGDAHRRPGAEFPLQLRRHQIVEAPVQRHVGYDARDHRFAFFAPAGLRSGLR